MIAGTIAALEVGDLPGYGMRRGTLVVGKHGALSPTFVETGSHDLVFLRLLAKQLGSLSEAHAALLAKPLRRYSGDLATIAKGEIWARPEGPRGACAAGARAPGLSRTGWAGLCCASSRPETMAGIREVSRCCSCCPPALLPSLPPAATSRSRWAGCGERLHLSPQFAERPRPMAGRASRLACREVALRGEEMSPSMSPHRHCERSEAFQAGTFPNVADPWIASLSLARTA